MKTLTGGLGLTAAFLASSASAQELPDSLADMIREANTNERDTIENVAKRLYPDKHEAIDDLIDDIEDEEEAETADKKFLAGWNGEVELGGSYTSGNVDEWSVIGSADLERKGIRWDHSFDALVELRSVNNQRTEERVSLGYRADYTFPDSRWFAFGTARYDRNRFKDIDRRFTEAVGFGYDIIDTDDLEWSVAAGPALRQTLFTAGLRENELAGFATTEFELEITETLAFVEEARLILDKETTSFESTTSLTQDLFGSAYFRLSFTVLSESTNFDRDATDTITRASVVFDF